MRRTRRRHRRRNPSASAYTTHWKKASSRGRKLLKKFWGIKRAPTIRLVGGSLPGVGKNSTLVGLGQSPAITIADGPRQSHKKMVRKKHHGQLVSDDKGKRLFILSGRPATGRKKFLGWVPELEYIPYPGVESMGSFKRGKHWIHQMGEGKGPWPKIYSDNGNYIVARGSHHVGKWIYR